MNNAEGIMYKQVIKSLEDAHSLSKLTCTSFTNGTIGQRFLKNMCMEMINLDDMFDAIPLGRVHLNRTLYLQQWDTIYRGQLQDIIHHFEDYNYGLFIRMDNDFLTKYHAKITYFAKCSIYLC